MDTLNVRVEKLKSELMDNEDVVSRFFKVVDTTIAIVFIKSMINDTYFIEGIASKIIEYDKPIIDLKSLKAKIVCVDEIEEIEEKNIVDNILLGKACILLENSNKSLAIDIEEYPKRVPTEPPTSAVIRGPREGFTESIKTNISMMRKRLPTNDLKIQDFQVGRYTRTKIKVIYLNSVADKKIVKEITKKIKNIDIDGVIDSHSILEFLQYRPNSLFKQVGTSEKPDIIAGKMLEGRIAIIVDGSPIVLTIPFIFLEDLQNSNDYYTNHHYVSFIRVIRTLGILTATIIPGVYIALRLYHYKITPIKFLITIANSTQGLPFTPFLELIFILILFHILYEVSLRLPRYLGLATSIVGALILGDTGVKAGLISPPGVIIIAMSIISVYTVPDQEPQLTILRIIFLVLGGCLGILGVVGGIVYFVNYMNSLNVYTAPYLAPFSPSVKSDFKDAVFKAGIVNMKKRPRSFKQKNIVRLVDNDKSNKR